MTPPYRDSHTVADPTIIAPYSISSILASICLQTRVPTNSLPTER